MVFCVHIPLGLLRRIDILGFTSFIGMICMSTFVVMVIMKQPEAAALCGEIEFLSEDGNPARVPQVIFMQILCHFLKKTDIANVFHHTKNGQCRNIMGLDFLRNLQKIYLFELCALAPEPIQECTARTFNYSAETIYAIPMLLFSFMCHGNILTIVAELKSPTKYRMRQFIAGKLII